MHRCGSAGGVGFFITEQQRIRRLIREVVPYWRGEQKMLEAEERQLEAGAEPRDLSEHSEWRKTVDQCVLDALTLYGTYLIGQSAGMSDALSLGAIVTACDIEGIPQESRPEFARHVLMIHSRNLELHAAENRKKKR